MVTCSEFQEWALLCPQYWCTYYRIKHIYADDYTLNEDFLPKDAQAEVETLSLINKNVIATSDRTHENRLKPSADKTEIMYFESLAM